MARSPGEGFAERGKKKGGSGGLSLLEGEREGAEGNVPFHEFGSYSTEICGDGLLVTMGSIFFVRCMLAGSRRVVTCSRAKRTASCVFVLDYILLGLNRPTTMYSQVSEIIIGCFVSYVDVPLFRVRPFPSRLFSVVLLLLLSCLDPSG